MLLTTIETTQKDQRQLFACDKYPPAKDDELVS